MAPKEQEPSDKEKDKPVTKTDISRLMSFLARKNARRRGKQGNVLRARLGGYGKSAKAAGMTLTDYIKWKARQEGVTEKELLSRPPHR